MKKPGTTQTYLVVLFDGRVFLDLAACVQTLHEAYFVVTEEAGTLRVLKDALDPGTQGAETTAERALERATYHVRQARFRPSR